MIVQCEQCQTQFRVPDDKISDKGVKVRCTKCQYTFRVSKNRDAERVASHGAPAKQEEEKVHKQKEEQAQVTPPVGSDPFAAFESSPSVQEHSIVTGGGTALDFSSVVPQVPVVGKDAAAWGAETSELPPESQSPTAWNVGEGDAPLQSAPDSQAFEAGDGWEQASHEPLQNLFDTQTGMVIDGFSSTGSAVASSSTSEQARPLAPQADFAPERLVPQAAPPTPVLGAKTAVLRADTGPQTQRNRLTPLDIVFKVIFAATLAIGSIILVSAYFNEGKVSAETLSLAYFKLTFFSDVSYVTDDISNGLYETKTGKQIFFVSGKATNLGDKPVRLMVRTELVEGSTVVRHVESIAGAPPSPEELYSLSSSEDLDVLNMHVAERAPVVQPGASAPFVTTFFEYPLDLKGCRVRVSANALTQPLDS